MKNKIILTALICFALIISSSFSLAQNEIKLKKKELRNSWGLSFVYSESGFGISGSVYTPIGKSSDLFFNLLFSGVADGREFEQYDFFGNSIVPNKINRVYMIPLSIGVKTELFKEDIEGDFTPVINFGVAPTLVLSNPYDKSFFKAFSYVNAYFAAGPFAGIGINFKQSESMSLNFNANYYYLPVIGKELRSLKDNTITNLGGFQLTFGINFMH